MTLLVYFPFRIHCQALFIRHTNGWKEWQKDEVERYTKIRIIMLSYIIITIRNRSSELNSKTVWQQAKILKILPFCELQMNEEKWNDAYSIFYISDWLFKMVMEDIRLVSSFKPFQATNHNLSLDMQYINTKIWNPLVVHILIWVCITGSTDISHFLAHAKTRRNQNSNTIFFGLFFIPNNAVSLDWMVFSCFFLGPFQKSKPLPTAIGPLFRISVKISNRFIWIWWFNKKKFENGITEETVFREHEFEFDMK